MVGSVGWALRLHYSTKTALEWRMVQWDRNISNIDSLCYSYGFLEQVTNLLEVGVPLQHSFLATVAKQNNWFLWSAPLSFPT